MVRPMSVSQELDAPKVRCRRERKQLVPTLGKANRARTNPVGAAEAATAFPESLAASAAPTTRAARHSPSLRILAAAGPHPPKPG
ncbi:hypothetical protein GCM10027564_22340 [Luteimonas notoginsengisoli]